MRCALCGAIAVPGPVHLPGNECKGMLRERIEELEAERDRLRAELERYRACEMSCGSDKQIIDVLCDVEEEKNRLRAALEAVEWRLEWCLSPNLSSRRHRVCPWCEMEDDEGHAPDCRRQRALGVKP